MISSENVELTELGRIAFIADMVISCTREFFCKKINNPAVPVDFIKTCHSAIHNFREIFRKRHVKDTRA